MNELMHLDKTIEGSMMMLSLFIFLGCGLIAFAIAYGRQRDRRIAELELELDYHRVKAMQSEAARQQAYSSLGRSCDEQFRQG